MVLSGTIKVLHVDDDPDITDLTARFLHRENKRLEIHTADSPSEGLYRLTDTDFDCIVSDYQMPGRNGIEFLEVVREDFPKLPFILFTGKGSEEVASDAISAGVTDYLQKGSGTSQYEVLANRIVNAAEGYRIHELVEDSERRLKSIAEHSNDILWNFTGDWDELLFINSPYQEIWGRSIGELREHPESLLKGVHPDDRAKTKDAMNQLSSGESIDYEHRVNADEDFQRWVWVQGEPIFDESGAVEEVVGFARDITDRKERELHHQRGRNRFQAVFEESFDAMVIADDDGLYLEANESATTLFGVAEGELLGRSIVEFAPDDFDFDEAWSEFQTSEKDRGIFPLVRPDGTRRLVEYGATPNIVPGQHLSILRDVTEQREREQELQTRTKQLQDVIDSVEGAMWIRNADSEYVYMNQYHRDLFGIAEDVEIGGKRFTDLLPADVATQFQENDQRVYETEEPVEIEEPVETDEGPIHFLTRIVPLFKNGSVYATCGIATDVTVQKIRERQLEQFANIVSHDLRNPLTVANGRLELAAEECDSEHLDAIKRAHERMSMLIDDLLTLARDGEVVAETTSVDLASLVDGCWAHVETGGTMLVADIERTVQADESRLEQVFENLIRNAIEHGGEDVTVTVGALADGFYVEDDGPGIPAEDRDDIFESGYSTTEDGTGFGLSIVKQIVDAHNWSLRVTDGAEGGARFEITGVKFAAE